MLTPWLAVGLNARLGLLEQGGRMQGCDCPANFQSLPIFVTTNSGNCKCEEKNKHLAPTSSEFPLYRRWHGEPSSLGPGLK